MIQAAAPILTVVLATRIDPTQRVRGLRLVGVGIGFVGVALLVGVQEGGQLVGALAVLGTATCYAVSVLYAGRAIRSFAPLEVTIGQLAVGTLLAAPVALAQLPSEAPAAKAVAAIVALGALGTGLAYLLYFTLIARAGASRAILVTYLVPAFALVYGTLILDEPVTASAVAGLALILGGTALGTGRGCDVGSVAARERVPRPCFRPERRERRERLHSACDARRRRVPRRARDGPRRRPVPRGRPRLDTRGDRRPRSPGRTPSRTSSACR